MSTPQNKNKDVQAHTGSTPAPAAGGASRSASSTGTASAAKSQSILSLPSGGGALRGIGEKFATNPATGTSSFSIPLPLSPARGARPADPDNGQEATLGFAPELSLAYDSGSGNGLFGLGWSVATPSISRKTDKGLPRYQDTDESDVFLLSGAEDLVPITDSNGNVIVADVGAFKVRTYCPRTEGLYARIQRFDLDNRPVFWRTISKDNVTSYFKDTVQYGADDKRIFSWLLSYSYDDKGNAIEYTYLKDAPGAQERSNLSDLGRDILAYTSQPALHRVYYGNQHPYSGDGSRPSEATDSSWLFELAFDFGENEDALGLEAGTPWTMRPDAFSNYRAGFELRTWQLCRRVLLYHHFTDTSQPGHTNYDGVVKSLCFEYDRRPEGTRLTAVQAKGYSQLDGEYVEQLMPAVRFSYTAGSIRERLRTLSADSFKNLPQGVNGSNYQFADLFGEGSPGILTEQAGGWYYKRNLSAAKLEKHGSFLLPKDARFSSTRLMADRPAAGLSQGGQLTDLDGDGRQELVHFSGESPGFYTARNEDESWDNFQSFESLPKVDFAAQGLRFVDLTGDGRADILLTENEIFKVFESLGRQGYGPSRTLMQGADDTIAPVVTYSDDHQGIFLADMCGDGLSDIVRIRNGSISYWPNLGYGVFGRRVDMANAPMLAADGLFDPQRIRLGDVDGSGPTDLIYLGADGVCLYRNQSGSAWSNGYQLPVFPLADSLSTVMLADLHGAGTQCLVWSSPLPNHTSEPLRYLELFAEGKPNLLASIDNGMGAVTRITYAPSTHFYQCDMAEGKPWATRLYFPVQVVENVETLDLIARNRFVTRYAYHHGFFDGEEREFRGFGMVEQWDSESFASFSSTGDTWSWDHSENWNAATHVPPVHTKTWFHTGAFLEAGRLEEAYASDYFQEPGLSAEQSACLRLPSCLLDLGITDPAEHREALRTLRGKPLRVEIYADDDTDKAPYPYQVTESTYQVRRIQEKGKQRHGVFSAHPWQTLELHYERENLEEGGNPDPRTVQSMTLELDDFGNELKKLIIQHPRRTQDLPAVLPADTEDEWYAKSLLEPRFLYTEQLFTEVLTGDTIWRAPLPYHTRSYQLYRLQQKMVQDIGTTEPAVAFPKPLDGATYRLVDGDLLFRFDTAQESINAALASTLAFDDEFGLAEVSKVNIPAARLLSELIIQYWKNSESAEPAEYSKAEVPALVRSQFQLAFDETLMNSTMEGTDFSAGNGYQLLAEKGGFLAWDTLAIAGFSATENTWWKPSPCTYFQGQTGFFQSLSIKDAFRNRTSIEWDAYLLLPTSVTDARENRTSALYDYRTLHPSEVTDPNDCVQLAYYDSLGRLTATVVKGNPWAPTGDSFTGQCDTSEVDVANLITDLAAGDTTVAETLLGSATCRYIYDGNRFSRSSGKEPAIAVSIQREQHVNSGGTALQCSIAYSDGMGRAIQSKMRAGSGVALSVQSAKSFVDAILAGGIMEAEVLTAAHAHGFLGAPAYNYATMFANGNGKFDADALNGIFRLSSMESAPNSYLKLLTVFLGALREANIIDGGNFKGLMDSCLQYGMLEGNAAYTLFDILKNQDIPKSEDHDILAAMVNSVGGLSIGLLSYLTFRSLLTGSELKGDKAVEISSLLAAQATSSMSTLDIVRITAYFLQREGYLSSQDFEAFALRGPQDAVVPTLLDAVSITPTQASTLLTLADTEGWASVNVAKALFALLLTYGKITSTDKSDLDALADSYGFFRPQMLDSLMPRILAQDASVANSYAKILLNLSGVSLSSDIFQTLVGAFDEGDILHGCIRLLQELSGYQNVNVISLFTLFSEEPLCVDMSFSPEGLANMLLALYRKGAYPLFQAFEILLQIPEFGPQSADLMAYVTGYLTQVLTDPYSVDTISSIESAINTYGVTDSTYKDLRSLIVRKLPDSFSLMTDVPWPPVRLSKLWLDTILDSFLQYGLISTEAYNGWAHSVYKYAPSYWQFHTIDLLLDDTISDTSLTTLRSDTALTGSISDAQLEQYIGILQNHGFVIKPKTIPPFTPYGFILIRECLTQHGSTFSTDIDHSFLFGEFPANAVCDLIAGYLGIQYNHSIEEVMAKIAGADTVLLEDYSVLIAQMQEDGILPSPPMVEVDTGPSESAFCTAISGADFLLTESNVPVRWHTSGWHVFNNKGKPVRQYEPFCDSTPEFRPEYSFGVSPILFYDPLGRPIGVLHPDHSWEKTHIGAWMHQVHDVSDTLNLSPATDPILKSHFLPLPSSAYSPGWAGSQPLTSAHYVTESLKHADTPTHTLLDLTGQPLAHIADNRVGGGVPTSDTTLITWELKNTQGQRLAVLDPLGKSAGQYVYDMTGAPLRLTTPDAGTVYSLTTADGLPLAHRDTGGRWFLNDYDAARRPTSVRVRINLGDSSEQEISRMEYIDTAGQSPTDLPTLKGNHMIGRVVRVFDTAGMIRTTRYDRQGGPIQFFRQYLEDYKQLPDWHGTGEALLNSESFPTYTEYDALGRPTFKQDPTTYRQVFNYAPEGYLKNIQGMNEGDTDWRYYLSHVEYNARGQRVKVVYGNGIRQSYEYDPLTFRLTQLRVYDGTPTGTAVYQDLRYTYEVNGNVSSVKDEAQPTTFLGNTAVEPTCWYYYDSVSRLTEAKGREHIGQVVFGDSDNSSDSVHLNLPSPSSSNAFRPYTQEFTYDKVGNLLSLLHQGDAIGSIAATGYTRTFQYGDAARANRLTSTTIGSQAPYEYAYTIAGSINQMPHLQEMGYDLLERLAKTVRQVVTSGTAETTFYLYDMQGNRVRKVTDRYASGTPTRKSERLYFGDSEIYREYAGDGTTVTLQRTTDHISDEHGRFAMQERTGTQILLRYNHADPLESSRLETDALGRLIAYEEYHAYGTTAYQATLTSLAPGARRYRYAGKERDEESGLYYFGARYYAPWLGRFLSVDPKASKYVEWSPYVYTLNNPIRYVDPDGQEVKYTISNSYQGKDGKLHIVYKVDISIVLVKANRATQARLKLDEVAENLQAKLIKAVTVNSSSKTTVIEFKPGNVQVRAAYDLTGVKPKEHVGVIVDDVTGTTVDKNGKIGQAGGRAGYGKLTIYSENIDNNAERTAEVLLHEMGHSMGLEHNWVSSFTDDNSDSNPMSYANIPDGVFSPDQMLRSRDWYLGGKLNAGPNVQMLKKEDYSNSLTTEKHPYSYGNPGDVFPASIDL